MMMDVSAEVRLRTRSRKIKKTISYKYSDWSDATRKKTILFYFFLYHTINTVCVFFSCLIWKRLRKVHFILWISGHIEINIHTRWMDHSFAVYFLQIFFIAVFEAFWISKNLQVNSLSWMDSFHWCDCLCSFRYLIFGFCLTILLYGLSSHILVCLISCSFVCLLSGFLFFLMGCI